MALHLVTRRRVFQQPPFQSRTALPPPGTWPVFSLMLCGKINGGMTSPSLITTPNTMMWTVGLPFILRNIYLTSDYHTHTHTEIFKWKLLPWMPTSIAYHFQISGGVISAIVIIFWCKIDFILLYKRQSPKKIKNSHEIDNSKRQKLTYHIQNIYIYIYIYIYNVYVLLAYINLYIYIYIYMCVCVCWFTVLQRTRNLSIFLLVYLSLFSWTLIL